MPTVVLTDIAIRHLKPVPGRRITYLDKQVKGFGVRVTTNGAMSYVLTFGPNRQRVKLGDVGIVKLSEARQKAKTLLAEKQLGRHSPTKAPAYATALDEFLVLKAVKLKPRTLRDYTRLLTRHGFGQQKLDAIAPHDIYKKIDKLPPGERVHAHVALALFMRWCFKRHYLDRNPMERMDKPQNGNARTRILSDDELKAVWNACSGLFGDIVKLCLLTGQRRSEIAQLQWPWLQENILTIPAYVAKNKVENRLPIGTMALAVLNQQVRRNDTPYVFPARPHARGKKAKFYGSWGRDKASLDKASGVTGWVIHDLRRTFRTKWSELGILREVAEKYINHVSGVHSGVSGVYDRYAYLPEMRRAVVLWEAHLMEIIQCSTTTSPSS